MWLTRLLQSMREGTDTLALVNSIPLMLGVKARCQKPTWVNEQRRVDTSVVAAVAAIHDATREGMSKGQGGGHREACGVGHSVPCPI